MKYPRILWPLLWLTTAVLGHALPQFVPLSIHYEPKELFGERYIWAIAEGKNGQVIASGETVMYYEHHRWSQVPDFRRRAIRCLVVKGWRLYVATGNEVGFFDLPLTQTSKFTLIKELPWDAGQNIWNFVVEGGKYVAAAAHRVAIIDQVSGEMKVQAFTGDSRIWLVHTGGETILNYADQTESARLDGMKFSPLIKKESDPYVEWWIAGGPDWAHGYYNTSPPGAPRKKMQLAVRFDDRGNITEHWDFGLPRENLLVTTSVRWGDYLVVGLTNDGLVLVNLNTREVTRFGPDNGLDTPSIMAMMPDSRGSLWTGTANGITVYEPPTAGLIAVDREKIVQAHLGSGRLVTSYAKKTVILRPDGTTDEIPIQMIGWSRVEGTDPLILLWDKMYYRGNFLNHRGITDGAALHLGGSRFFLSSVEKTYFLDTEAGTVEPVDNLPAEVGDFATYKGTLWGAGTDGFVYSAPVNNLPSFSRKERVTDFILRQIVADDDFGIVIASANSVFFGPNWKRVKGTERLEQLRLTKNLDGIWLVGRVDDEWRLGRIGKTTSGEVAWTPYIAKGLNQLSEIRTFDGDAHELLMFGGGKLLRMPSAELALASNNITPTLWFSYDAASGHRIRDLVLPKKLTAAHNHLTVAASSEYNEFGERVGYEARLLPTETEWARVKESQSFSYPALASGSYSLEVRPLYYGSPGSILRHDFTVLPPWYFSWPAVIAYIGLAAGFAFGADRLRTKAITIRNAELEKLVSQRTDELAKASAAKTEFLASMSHEIRNPMNGVIGLLRVLAEDTTGAKQKRTIKMLQGCAEQLSTTVEDILDFSKIEAGRIDLDQKRFNLMDTLEGAAVSVNPGSDKVIFSEHPSPELQLYGDEGKIRQIFANLIGNALKYGSPPQATVAVNLAPVDGKVRLTVSVSSTGPTITGEELQGLFESFRRGESAVAKNIRGTGLGLAICRRYARAMGGEASAVSENGVSTFYFYVMLDAIGDAQPASVVVPQITLGRRARTLAVEDEHYNRIVLGNILSKLNYEVDWAVNAAEAIKRARETDYDVILTDYRLPDATGVDVAREILSWKRHPRPAIFAVTAYSTKERQEECMRAGMSGFISKPISVEKLQAEIARWAGVAAPASSIESPIGENVVSAPRQSVTGPDQAEQIKLIEPQWFAVVAMLSGDPKRAAFAVHALNNLCRAVHEPDVAEQLEQLENALEKGLPIEAMVSSCERLMRAQSLIKEI